MIELIRKKALIDIDLAPKWDMIFSGIPLISNSKILILLNFNEESAEFDGFSIFKNEDVEQFREWEKDDLTEIKNDNSVQQLNNAEFSSFQNLETSFNNLKSELVAVFTYEDTDSYFVGKVLKVKNDSVELQLIDTESIWINNEVIEFKDISYVGFRTNYEKELWNNVLQH